MHNHPRYIQVMEALQLKPVRVLAKCQPVMPSGYELEQAANGICMEMTCERRYLGSALPTVDEGFDAYMSETRLTLAVYPDGEFTEFGLKLFNMFAAAWADAMEEWK